MTPSTVTCSFPYNANCMWSLTSGFQIMIARNGWLNPHLARFVRGSLQGIELDRT
jgi:hypothetical protein